jgi:aspartyl-tRNA(Asn)/glutamyl-tRNA(Gln) amidotransferase subunit C
MLEGAFNTAPRASRNRPGARRRANLRSPGPYVTSHRVKITREQVRHVAALARLDLSPEEEERIAGELEAILGYVAKLDELDVEDVEPTAHVFDVGAAFREDVVENQPACEELLENAPDRWRGFFRVPKIIE